MIDWPDWCSSTLYLLLHIYEYFLEVDQDKKPDVNFVTFAVGLWADSNSVRPFKNSIPMTSPMAVGH